MKPKLFVFILGFIVGLLVALVVPPLLESWLPPGFLGGKGGTVGQVVAKRLQEDRLLLTIESEEGAVLATFKERVSEIDLLVDKGDRVTLAITSYEPFVEDPRILGVKKGPEGVGAEAGEMAEELPGPAAEGPEGGEPGELAEPAEASDEAEGEAVGEEVTLPPMGPPLEDQAEEPPRR